MQTLSLKREFPRWQRWFGMVTGTEQVPIGRTPREAVYTRDHLTVYRYRRDTPALYTTPLLLVYSLINRPAVLDLIPGRSVVEHMLRRGFDVYLLDWGVPDAMDQFVGLDLHVNLLLRTAVREVCRHAGTRQTSVMGYCMGGTLAAMYAALHPQRVKNLVLLGAPVNHRSEQKLYEWGTDKEFFDPKKVADAYGIIPTWTFEGFNMLQPGGKIPRMVTLYDQLDNEAFVESYLAMEQWVSDNIPMGAAVYEEHIRTCWQENQLWEGRMELGGRRIDLSEISCPVLIIAGESDHLVPSETTVPLADRLRDAEVIVFPSGHVGLSVSGNSHRKLWPRACDWLAARSDRPAEG